jgi:hypothetical protein
VQQSKHCIACGIEFTRPARRSNAQWANMRCCSRTCANAIKARKQRPSQSTMRRWACAYEYRRMLEDKAELAASEQREARRQRRVARATKPLPAPRQFIAGTCPGCQQPVVVIRGWWHHSIRCSTCTKVYWRGNNEHRARRYGVDYEHIIHNHVFESDRWICQLCGVRTIRKPGTPRSATIDHIIPLARGGPHTRDNVQTACARCNFTKGARSANDQLRMAV